MRSEKITPDLISAICEDIAKGFSYEKAALNNGISASTFFRWLKLGKTTDSELIYQHFVQEVKAASEFSEDEALQIVRSAATVGRNWKASAWFLEKRFPDKYGKRFRDKAQSQEEEDLND